MKIFARADAGIIKKTIAIYREEVRKEKRDFILASVAIPIYHFFLVVVIPLLISFFLQALITNPSDLTLPIYLLVAMAAISIANIFISHFGYIALFNHQERIHTRLGEKAMSKLLAHSHGFFANSKVGSLTGDVATFAKSYQMVTDVIFLQASGLFVNFIASMIVVAFIAPAMTPVLLLLTILVIGDALRSYARRGTHRVRRRDLQSQLFGMVSDALGNSTLIRMFGRSQHEVDRIVQQRKSIEAVAYEEIKEIQSGSETRLVIVFTFQTAILIFCMLLFSNGEMSIAAFIFIITYLGRVTGSMFALNPIIRMLEQGFLEAAKITEILDLTPEIQDKQNAKKLVVKHADIEFKDVAFAYEDAKKQIVFKDFNLSIKKGQSIGLVGRSGGGKSTLTHLLLRYMDIDEGEILIDGQNISDVTQVSLRRSISYVPQDPFLFHRTLRENIAYGSPGVTDEEVRRAAKKAHALEFIDKLPKGLDTVVGERGVKLSGGQRQRIAIARAILKDAPILVLDEATSALDSESEKLIQDSLEALMKGKTSIVIAHRLSTIAKLDRIIVIDDGRIIEDDSHKQLLQKDNIYAKLWKHQSGGFIDD